MSEEDKYNELIKIFEDLPQIPLTVLPPIQEGNDDQVLIVTDNSSDPKPNPSCYA